MRKLTTIILTVAALAAGAAPASAVASYGTGHVNPASYGTG